MYYKDKIYIPPKEDTSKVETYTSNEPFGIDKNHTQAPNIPTEENTNEILYSMIKDLQKVNLQLTERIQKLEYYQNEWLKTMGLLGDKIQKLEEYDKQVYRAFRALAEDYTEKVHKGMPALYNGILSILNKYDFVRDAIPLELKQYKWIVHRKLRTKNIEVYISKVKDYKVEYLVAHNCADVFGGYGENIFSCKNKELAYKFNLSNATRLRDLLNKDRVGKQYLWVISKVEE